MFFLAFASSIRIFTLFLNLINSEIFLIPTIILLTIIFAFFQRKKSSRAKAKDPGNITPMDSSAKIYTASSASEWQDKEKKNQIFDEILDETKI